MSQEILIPLVVELSSSDYVKDARERAAANADIISNLKSRLDSGVVRKWGMELPMFPVQIQRREELLPHLEESLLYDLETIKLEAWHLRHYEHQDAQVGMKIPDELLVKSQGSKRVKELRANVPQKIVNT